MRTVMQQTPLLSAIAALPDDTAQRILESYIKARGADVPVELSKSTVQSLIRNAAAPAAGAAPPPRATDGDLARAALALLALDPQAQDAIRAMVTGPQLRSFFVAEVAVLTLAVSVLMSSGTLTKGPNGWEISIKKDALNTDQLKAFLNVVAGWFGAGG